MNVVTLLWFGGMLLISMLLYLFFELFDPIEINDNGAPVGRRSSVKTLFIYWRRQKRLSEVVSIAMKNGVTRTVKYARSREDERELAIALRDTLEQCGGFSSSLVKYFQREKSYCLRYSLRNSKNCSNMCVHFQKSK